MNEMMNVKVVYLARLREALGCREETLSVPGAATLAEVIRLLRARGEPWSHELGEGRAVRSAVNHEVADLATVLHENDEVAFFPPVTGG